METCEKKLVFGDPESIAIRDQFREKKEKESAEIVSVLSEEIEQDPIYELSWHCPNCGRKEYSVPEEEIPYDKFIKCYQCKKWLRLKI